MQNLYFCFDIKNNICTQHGVNLYFSGNSINNLVILRVNWFKNKSFWKRFTCTKCYLRCYCQNEFGNNYCSSVYGLEFPEITDFITGCRVSKCLRKHPNFFPFFRQNLVGWTQIDCDIDLEVESVGAHSSTINMGWNNFWRRISYFEKTQFLYGS